MIFWQRIDIHKFLCRFFLVLRSYINSWITFMQLYIAYPVIVVLNLHIVLCVILNKVQVQEHSNFTLLLHIVDYRKDKMLGWMMLDVSTILTTGECYHVKFWSPSSQLPRHPSQSNMQSSKIDWSEWGHGGGNRKSLYLCGW